MNTPDHYNDKITTVNISDDYNLNFNIANVFKYLQRSKRKGSELEDLNKALNYLNFEINRRDKLIDLKEAVNSWNLDSNKDSKDDRLTVVLDCLINAVDVRHYLIVAKHSLENYIKDNFYDE